MEMVEKSKQMGVPVTIFDGGDLVVGFAPEMYEELLKKNGII